ncbi:MAG: hypothetical protein O3B41_05375 [Bacteroidetes bacterium]|nr:hypothetical protein [Bacteroidota bacterium]
MDSKTLTNVAIGAVTFFLLGYLLYGLALGSYLADHFTAGREVPIWWSLIVSQIALSVLACTAIKWNGAADYMSGAKAAVGIGFFYAVAYACDAYATMDVMDTTGVVVGILGESLRFFVVGGVLGWFAGRGK